MMWRLFDLLGRAHQALTLAVVDALAQDDERKEEPWATPTG